MKQIYLKWAVSILGAIYCLYYLSTLDTWHFIDNVDLVIHEAGHVVFFILGMFFYIAGGSLMQLIMPALFIGYFYRTNQKYSASLVAYWLAVNFFSVGHYAADAQVMRLELLGGDSSGHDWNNLLSMLGLLNQTKFIAGLIYFAGIVCIGAGLYLTYRAFKPAFTTIN